MAGFEPANTGVMAVENGTAPPSICTSCVLLLDDSTKSSALPLGDIPIYGTGEGTRTPTS